MANQVPLPPSVESLIQHICLQQSLPLPMPSARQELAALGEEDSLRLLTDISKTNITRSFDGFIMYLAKQYRSPASPGSFASPAAVVLPTAVEDLIGCICNEQSQPPLGASAKRKLSMLGEQEALRLLNQVRLSKITKSFDGFVTYLANSGSPTSVSPRQESVVNSPSFASSSSSLAPPNFRALDEVSSSVQDRLTRSPISTTRQPVRRTLLPCVNKMQSFEDAPYQDTNGRIPYGQTFSSSTSGRKLDDQLLLSSNNIFHPNNAQALVPSMNSWNPNGQTSSPVLQALHELEFRKAFLILSYIGRNKLEEVTSVMEIKGLATAQSMGVFENKIWDRFGSRYCEKKDRIKHADWECGRRYYYHCYVYSDGSYSLKGPYLNKTATLLQKVLGDENVLIVKFYDLDNSTKNYGSSVSYAAFHKLANEGIFVGLKRFRFFVYKDGGKDEKNKSSSGSGAIKSYYVNVDSFARFYENKDSCLHTMSMHDKRSIFMHVHNVSSLSAYMARFSLVLSKTITLDVNLEDPDVHVEVIDDIPCKDVNGLPIYEDGKLQIHTDGTGFISEELALRCPQNCYKGNSLNEQFLKRYLEIDRLGNASTSKFRPDMLQPPLLIQCRMFHNGRAVKGIVVVNKKLQGKRIQIRPSMIKVESDPELFRTPAVNSFEIVSTSNRPRKTRLSRYLIALLNYGGVPREFFINILENEIWNALNIFSSKRAALKVAVNHGVMDDNYTVARMILSGIPLDESYIQWWLPVLGKIELRSLQEGKLPINDSFYVMGTADPTGSLKSDEVCIVHETGQIEGNVLVYRSPGVHFGDVHILKATRVKGLEDVVGTSKYGIFFPTNGPRSLADKMAGGDFDGDMYFVSRHPTLLTTFKQSEPWTPSPIFSQQRSVNKKPSDFTAEELEHELFQLFLTKRFQPCISTGKAANSWLCYMDQYLGDEPMFRKLDLEDKMRKLVDIYYEALDAPKKGKKVEVPDNLKPAKFPHFMGHTCTYQSKSVLGEIFDKAIELKMEAPVVQVGKLSRFDIEIPMCYITLWGDHYVRYRSEMNAALKCSDDSKDDAARNVYKKYKQILYGCDELEMSPRSWEEIRFDALAIYHVVYGYAMQMDKASSCGFVWKVACSALLKIFTEEQEEKPIFCLPSVLREIL